MVVKLKDYLEIPFFFSKLKKHNLKELLSGIAHLLGGGARK